MPSKPAKAHRIRLVESEVPTLSEADLTLLTGKPYTNAAKTDILATFRRFGWIPPSEERKGHKWV